MYFFYAVSLFGACLTPYQVRFAFLIAWSGFFLLCGVLAWLVLRRR